MFGRRRKAREQDLERELRSDLEMEAAEQQENGLSAEEARYAARRAFGNAALVKEEVRAMWRWATVDRFGQDLKYAARTLRRDRGFTAIAILTLMLGIGATTAIFSVIDGVLLRPLPYREPDRLFSVQEKGPGFGNPASYPDFDDWRAQNHVFAEMASYHGEDFTVTTGNGALHVPGVVASANLLSVLQVHPMLGRGFELQDSQPGRHVVLISDRLWHQQFHADRSIVGGSLQIGQNEFTVVGVMPPGFRFPPTFDGDLWVTSAVDKGAPKVQRGYSWLSVVGRLKPGITPAEAQADMNVIARRLAKQYPETNAQRTSIQVVMEQDRIVGSSRSALMLLLGVAAGVLLIACVNLANMSLARNLARQREIAIRAALGAKRRSVVAQLLTESVLASFTGGCFGVALALWSTRTLLAAIPRAIPRAEEVGLDLHVLGFAAIISVLTGILFGLIPAWQISAPKLETALRKGRQTASEGIRGRRFRDVLLATETALAVVLLAAAGLLITSYLRLVRVNPGFDPRNVLTFDLSLPVPPYTADRQLRFYEELLSRLNQFPQVKSAVAGWPVPFTSSPSSGFEIEGRPFPPGYMPTARVHVVTPGYFRALGMQLKAGRDFTDRDNLNSSPVVIVDEAFVQQFFPKSAAVGKKIKPSLSMSDTPPWRDIVGVVNSTKRLGLAEAFQPQYYIPYAQLPGPQPEVILKIEGAPLAIIPMIRDTVTSIDKDVPVYDVKSINEIIGAVTARERLNTILFGLFGALAVLLAAIGIYGVANYSVNRATHELGIRMALGAQARDVLMLTVTKTLRYVAFGLIFGLIMTLSLTRLIGSLLYGVRPTDPVLIAAACIVFIAVAAIATYIPARRATKVDPLVALRYE
ncbi:MAG TPA: ABC transporter permease [Bryobacteraceae bacterium]|nr:ABC transporter permease [Bryobacteraceae bacterium]